MVIDRDQLRRALEIVAGLRDAGGLDADDKLLLCGQLWSLRMARLTTADAVRELAVDIVMDALSELDSRTEGDLD